MKHYPAPAKINLHLKVTALLENGYHLLDTSFAYIDVADHLHIELAQSLEVTCSEAALSGPNNLVWKVLDAMQREFNISQGLKVYINKTLPAQAGLGGGSSDAATALMVANRLWQLNLDTQTLINFAAPFGADIPCFLFRHASLAHGIGEKLLPWPGKLPEETILLAYPGSGLSTAEVFGHFDRHTSLTPSGDTDKMRAVPPVVLGENDLEASACALSSDVAALLQRLRNEADQAWMSGSGSTCVALFENHGQASQLATSLHEQGLASWTHVGKILQCHPLKG